MGVRRINRPNLQAGAIASGSSEGIINIIRLDGWCGLAELDVGQPALFMDGDQRTDEHELAWKRSLAPPQARKHESLLPPDVVLAARILMAMVVFAEPMRDEALGVSMLPDRASMRDRITSATPLFLNGAKSRDADTLAATLVPSVPPKGWRPGPS